MNTTQHQADALTRIRDKLLRAGAEIPIRNEGTIESAMRAGHSHALLLVEEELAALASQPQQAEPDMRHPKIQSLIAMKARAEIRERALCDIIAATTLEEMDELLWLIDDYVTTELQKAYDLKRATLSAPQQAEPVAANPGLKRSEWEALSPEAQALIERKANFCRPKLYTAPQPAAVPAGFIEWLERFPELNTANYTDDEVDELNNWGIEGVQAFLPDIHAAPSAPSAAQAGGEAPIDMVLHCPKCGMQHIDAPEPAIKTALDPNGVLGWPNPPHRSHLCHGCGHIWRPADVPTNGVAAVKTTGKSDSPIAAPASPAAPDDVRRDAERYRWLRQEHERVDPVCHLSWKRGNDRNSSEWVNTARLDAAIDAALAASKQGGAA